LIKIGGIRRKVRSVAKPSEIPHDVIELPFREEFGEMEFPDQSRKYV
jgi:hypothetical protein